MKITDEDRRRVARNLSAALPRNSRSVITDEERTMVARNIWEEQRRSEEKAYQEKQRQMMSGYTSGKLELMSEEQTREHRMAARSYDAAQQRQAQQEPEQQQVQRQELRRARARRPRTRRPAWPDRLRPQPRRFCH